MAATAHCRNFLCPPATGVYYGPPLAANGTTDWTLFLEGGGWCYDEGSCAERRRKSPSLMSSAGWPKQVFPDGVLSAYPSHDPLWTAHKLYVKYCTSDGHMGDRAASPATYGLHFRGRRVIAAAVAAMKAKGLGQGTARHRVFFGGASAGGRGAMVSVDPAVGP